MPVHPSIRITCRDLRDKFNNNEGGYPERIAALRCVCIHDGLANSKSGQPPGTRSQLHQYFDGVVPVMWLHRFVLPSGKLGASGKVDPKRLLVDGVYYYCS